MLLKTTIIAISFASIAIADTVVPTSPSEIKAALSYENYDRDLVVAIVETSELPDYNKEGILDALARFNDNPEAIKSILLQTRQELGLE